MWVTATGTRSLEAVLAMSKDILAAMVESGVKKALVDVRALEGRLGTIDSYELVDQEFQKLRDPVVITCCAIVDRKEFENGYRFFENVAVNRGYALRIFPDPEEALLWLTNR